MSLISFLAKQFIGVIQWSDPQDGILAYRYPMRDLEIQGGGQLTVSESQMAAFVSEERMADIFGPGLHTLSPRNLPLLNDMLGWDRGFELPFKSAVYFFSTRLQAAQKWATAAPITVRDKDFGAVRLRAFGTYSYRIVDPHLFFNQVSGTRERYFAADLEGELRETIVAHMAGVFAKSGLPLLDLAANKALLGAEIVEQMKPIFAALGLELIQVVVENVSLPEELTKARGQRTGLNGGGELGRYTRFAETDGQDLAPSSNGKGLGVGAAPVTSLSSPAATKSCHDCGESIPGRAKYCSDCGKAQ